MFIDLSHNFVVKNTITVKFSESVNAKLVPRLVAKYGESLLGIQMYEDYISDAFYSRGEWYYPLTVILTSGPVTEWVKWKMKAGAFKDGIPYAYVGEGLLDINIVAEAPYEFAEKLAGRAICSTEETLKINIETTATDPTFLSGRYSQTFVDEMARQLASKISEAMSVEGIEGGAISLSLVFAPATYMEHTSENVTYRRLLIADSASAPRDFWVKWTREDGAMAYTVSDHVSAENITFEIGEDVPQKVREKEYRFLLSAGGDKYHNAMGRKNITEWRELIKRAIRRGDLIKIEPVVTEEQNDDLTAALAAVLGKEPTREETPAVEQPVAENEEFARAMAMARAILSERESVAAENAHEPVIDQPEPESEPEIETTAIPAATPSIFDIPEVAVSADEAPAIEAEPDIEKAPVIESAPVIEETPVVAAPVAEIASADVFEDIEDEEALEDEESTLIDPTMLVGATSTASYSEPETPAPVAEPEPAAPAVSREEIEAKIRAEIETRVRLEYESRARRQAEEEAEKHRLAAEELRRKNQELIEAAEAERARQAQLAEQLRAEAKERERLAEAARIALEQARKEEEEKARAAALARAVEERRREEERLAAEERRRAAEAAKREAERKAEEERLAKIKATEALAGNAKSKNYTYTSKTVKFLFRRAVDPNITARIYEIIKTTLEYYGKEKMYMRIKATIPDTTTVILEFVEIPMEEMTLLSNIIKVLGNSGLGIAKAIVE